MAPRGRPSRSGNSRMHAAIDAMKPFGFTKEVVTAKMRQLLKEYEGEYMFIEADAYSVLLHSLLPEEDTTQNHQLIQQEGAIGESSNLAIMEDKEVKDDHAMVLKDDFIDIPICSSTTPPPPPPSPPLSLPPPPPSSPPPLQPPPPSSPPPPPPPPPPPSSPPPPPPPLLLPPPPPLPPHMLHATLPPPKHVELQRRKPCHGWIDDEDNEEPIFMLLRPFNGQISPPAPQPELTSEKRYRSRQRSRWDMRPEDMQC